MKGLAGTLLFVVAILWNVDATNSLKCRQCIGANSLDECTLSIPCPPNEICYIDEVLTQSSTIEYNGGCRPRDVCPLRPSLGKRASSGQMMICTGCCDTDRKPECNTKICGIKPSQSNLQQCNHCKSSAGGGGSGVSDPNACINLVTCQSDEICAVDTYRLAGNDVYEFGCMTKGMCKLLTTEALHRKKECEYDPSVCSLGNLRRETSGNRICTACCGDSMCNSDTCEGVIDRLYNLWKNGVLDINTLKQNGTLPTTTSAAPAP